MDVLNVCRKCIENKTKEPFISSTKQCITNTKCDICKKITNCYNVSQNDLIPSTIKDILDKRQDEEKNVDSPHTTQQLNSPSFIKGFDIPSILGKLTDTITDKSQNMTKAIMLDELNYVEGIIKDNPFDMNTEEIKQLKDYAKGLLLKYTKEGGEE